MRHYRKTDVQTHSDGFRPSNPAVNVKVRNRLDVPGCSEQAIEWAFEMEQEGFWEYWTDTTGSMENGLPGSSSEYLYFPGHNVRVYQEGRSGGWLVVHGLPAIEDWDAVLLARWRKFEKAVLEDVKYRTSPEQLREDIDANRWNEEGSQQYNFKDTPRGTVCFSDIYKTTHEYPLVIV